MQKRCEVVDGGQKTSEGWFSAVGKLLRSFPLIYKMGNSGQIRSGFAVSSSSKYVYVFGIYLANMSFDI